MSRTNHQPEASKLDERKLTRLLDLECRLSSRKLALRRYMEGSPEHPRYLLPWEEHREGADEFYLTWETR